MQSVPANLQEVQDVLVGLTTANCIPLYPTYVSKVPRYATVVYPNDATISSFGEIPHGCLFAETLA